MNALICPSCNSPHCKKNGHIHNGKQNYRCKDCGRQFVLDKSQKIISDLTKQLIKNALLERISLRGICRTFSVSLTWLLGYLVEIYAQLPADLNFRLHKTHTRVALYSLKVEADEMWSFVGRKSNKQWIWIALDLQTRQVIAFHVGSREKDAAKALFKKIPVEYQQNAHFYTDLYDSYVGVIPAKRHHRVIKQSGLTNHIERFNNTLRQRVSRLVRDTLSFSKKQENHVNAIVYFICHYNLTRQSVALHV